MAEFLQKDRALPIFTMANNNGDSTTKADDDATPTNLPSTNVLYMTYEGNWLTECESRVVHSTADDTSIAIVLDQTILHAQGGGQPTDLGVIQWDNKNEAEGSSSSSSIDITKVVMDRATGVVTHWGTASSQPPLLLPSIDTTVRVSVDTERRRILSECHTAGHVVDAAMERCGKLLKPSKGYHFLDSPYVEYQGVIPPQEKESLLSRLQEAFCQLVEEDIATEIALVSRQEANELCNRQAENFDMDVFAGKDGTVRVVTVAGFPCPCGGTHVRSTKELAANGWGITGFRSKKGLVRVKYGQGC